jgi:outer membrane protein OmpA-like peptidoglycan-associated protein
MIFSKKMKYPKHMKKILIYGLLVLLAMPLSAQRVLKLLEAGDEHFRKEEYTLAKDAYETILKRDRSANIRREVSFRLGQTYRQLLNYAEARKWYTLAMNVGYDNPEVYMHLSEMNLGLEDFDLAIEFANRFLEKVPGDRFGRKLLESAKFSKENYFKETLFEVVNERPLNTLGQEWGVAFFPDDRILFASTFTEDGRLDTRTGTGFSSIYESTLNRSTGEWTEPALIKGEINTIFYEGFLNFDPATQTGYYMNCGGRDGTRETCDIYTSKYNPETNTWGAPQIFYLNNAQYNIGYPSISDDGQTLFFGADMPGGYGGYDLYKMTKDPEDGKWSEPENLGPQINTSLNDSYPFIAGNILYFSSFGHPGFGGFDLFYAEVNDDGSFSKPVNMGSPINSSADDFGFIINKEYTSGFFTSDRPGGVGNDDLYSFRIVSSTFDLKGIITEAETGDPMPGIEVILYGDNDKILKVKSNSEGQYRIPQLDSEVNYIVEVVEDGFSPFSESLSVKDKLIASRFLSVPEFQKNVEMSPAPMMAARTDDELGPDGSFPTRPAITGITEGLPTVHFDFARFDLTSFAQLQLDSVLSFLDTQAGAGLVVHAHTDEVSGYLFNFYLSQKRAHTVIDYLLSRGISEDRLYPFGHGKMSLVVVNARTAEEHRLNRRATFEVIPMPDFTTFLADAPRHSFRYLNSLEKEAHYARGIEFMVQFAATRNPVHPQYYRRIMEAFPQMDILYYYDRDRFHRYSVGTFRQLNQAMDVHRRLRELGFDAFVVAFRNGERISLSEANQLLENQ